MSAVNIDDFCHFINQSQTPFHAVKSIGELSASLFQSDECSVPDKPSNQWVTPLSGGSVIGVTLPTKKLKSFRIIASHTDSPCLKLKPTPEKHHSHYRRWFTEVYGSPLLNSYLNHDLTIAGRITTHTPEGFKSTLVSFPDLKLQIPQLAIHLDREVNQKGLLLNPALHLSVILGTSDDMFETMLKNIERNISSMTGETFTFKHNSAELFLVSALRASLGGMNNSFIFAPRLDNLCMTYLSFKAWLASRPQANVANIFVSFNHEEIGSGTREGAAGKGLIHFLEQLSLREGLSRQSFLKALNLSTCISADMAHSFHPAYPERFDPENFPVINKGPVLKSNALHRYATDSESSALFLNLCQQAGVPCQNYNHRSDLGCGSTVGPIIASETGMRVMDVGNAMFSMHSSREMAGTKDLEYTYIFFKFFFEHTLNEYFKHAY